jgi:hypothetical protein
VNRVDTKPVSGAVLEERTVGDISGNFFVAGYQRGYRWGCHEVEQLLNDIQESRQQQSSSYYLQPVVVKGMADGRWELLDGQQRLTTLYLIQQHIKRTHLPSAAPRYELEYQTRPGSTQYLKDPDETRSWDNIDFFHIYRAAECIRQWFDPYHHGHWEDAVDFNRDLSRRVKII